MAEALLLHLHGDVLRALSIGVGVHLTGLHHGARLARRGGLIDNRMARKLTHIGDAFNVVRHLTEPGCQQFLGELRAALAPVPTNQAEPQATTLASSGSSASSLAHAAPASSASASLGPSATSLTHAATTPLDVFNYGEQSHAGHATPFGGERPGHTPLRGSQAPALIATPATVTSTAVTSPVLTLDIPGRLPRGARLEHPPGVPPPGCPKGGLGGDAYSSPTYAVF